MQRAWDSQARHVSSLRRGERRPTTVVQGVRETSFCIEHVRTWQWLWAEEMEAERTQMGEERGGSVGNA